MAKNRAPFPGKELADWAVDTSLAAKEKLAKAAVAVKEGHEQAVLKAQEFKRLRELRELRPVFQEDLCAETYAFPPMICIAEPDEKHARSPLCENAVGFLRSEQDLQILQIYPDAADKFGLTFFPATENAAFFVEDSQPNFYVNLDNYFEYQKKARIDELESIAFCLGAKHVEARLIESIRSEELTKAKAGGNGGKAVKADVSHETAQAKASRWEVALSSDFDGSDNPKRPVLHYFQNEASVQNLISMRMDSEHKILSKTYSWDFSHSSKIKEATALKIESALKKMKIGIHTSVVKQARTEERTMLKYTIDF
ncbi:MAG: hypothetical protein IJH47_03660 [Oscillospiraceae bacterium]|nr:hypothetical protein [Oscillospiraceae bacterium]